MFSVLTRLRIGHTRLTSSYLFLRAGRALCEVCNEELTVKHLLLSCSKFQNFRNLININDGLSSVLNDEAGAITSVLQFLKVSHLMYSV